MGSSHLGSKLEDAQSFHLSVSARHSPATSRRLAKPASECTKLARLSLGFTTMATAAALSIDHAALGRVALKTWPEAKMVSASQLWATGPCLVFAVRRMG
jgi:hypothetical protein